MLLGLDSEGEQDRNLHGPGAFVEGSLPSCPLLYLVQRACRPPLSSETCRVLFPPTGTRDGYLLCPAGIFHSIPPALGLEQLGVPSQVHCPPFAEVSYCGYSRLCQHILAARVWLEALSGLVSSVTSLPQLSCVYECLACNASRSQKRALELLELELRTECEPSCAY